MGKSNRWFISLGAVALIAASGCAHVANYYAANIDGKEPYVVMGCHGPTSIVSIDAGSGVWINAAAKAVDKPGVQISLDVQSNEDGVFSFISDKVLLSSSLSTQPTQIPIVEFTTSFPKQMVVPPTERLALRKYSNYRTEIHLPTVENEFYLQLPSAIINGVQKSFPAIHFKSTRKAYIGFCEA